MNYQLWQIHMFVPYSNRMWYMCNFTSERKQHISNLSKSHNNLSIYTTWCTIMVKVTVSTITTRKHTWRRKHEINVFPSTYFPERFEFRCRTGSCLSRKIIFGFPSIVQEVRSFVCKPLPESIDDGIYWVWYHCRCFDSWLFFWLWHFSLCGFQWCKWGHHCFHFRVFLVLFRLGKWHKRHFISTGTSATQVESASNWFHQCYKYKMNTIHTWPSWWSWNCTCKHHPFLAAIVGCSAAGPWILMISQSKHCCRSSAKFVILTMQWFFQKF